MKLKRVYIEIHNLCNLRCAFCHPSKRAPRSMTIDEIKRVVTQIQPVCHYVYLHIKGEPLLHPNFKEILDIMDDYKMQVQLVSNGTFLNRYPDLLQNRCLRKISFSLHSLPYQPLSVEAYMTPILTLAQQLSEVKRPVLELRFWNRGSLDERSKQALEMLLKIAPLKETGRKNSFQWTNNVYVHFEEPFEWPSSNGTAQAESGFCHGARTMIGVLADGTVVPCCLDDDGEIELGNLFLSSLEEILSQERYQAMLKGFRERKLIEPLCRRCTYRQRFD